jgi:hypothetical protein
VSYSGEHQPIVTRELWDKAHAILQESPRKRAANTRGQNTPALLKGLLFGPNGLAFTPAYTRRGRKLYRLFRLHRRDKTWARGMLGPMGACR